MWPLTSATMTSQSRPLLKPWGFPFTPTWRETHTVREPYDYIRYTVNMIPACWLTQKHIPGSAPCHGSASDQFSQYGLFSAAGLFSPKWFHPHARTWEGHRWHSDTQAKLVLNYLLNKQFVSHNKRSIFPRIYQVKLLTNNIIEMADVYRGSYPQRLRHSLPNSIALRERETTKNYYSKITESVIISWLNLIIFTDAMETIAPGLVRHLFFLFHLPSFQGHSTLNACSRLT